MLRRQRCLFHCETETKCRRVFSHREIMLLEFLISNHCLYSTAGRGLSTSFDLDHTSASSIIPDRLASFNFLWWRHGENGLPSKKATSSHEKSLPRRSSVWLRTVPFDFPKSYPTECMSHPTLLLPDIFRHASPCFILHHVFIHQFSPAQW